MVTLSVLQMPQTLVAEFIRPYSLAILPVDRVISTSADIAKILAILFKCGDYRPVFDQNHDLKPDLEEEHFDPYKPRILKDGKTVLISTFSVVSRK